MGSGQRQAELWGPGAKLWSEKHESYALNIVDWVLDRIYEGNGAHILDAGCGAGATVAMAVKRGARVTATDVTPEMLEIARQRVPQANFHVADSEALPFADNTFDSVMAMHSLQFTETPLNALHEFKRVSKPNAKIGIAMFGDTAHADFATIGAAVRKLFKTPPNFEGPFSLSPPSKLHGVIQQAGLKILETGDFDMEREFESFEEYWHGQAGTGATRYAVRELGEELVRDTVAGVIAQFTDSQGKITLRNRFHAVIAAKQ